MQLEKIFISYRRDDTSGYARAIYQHLVRHLGQAAVFMDVEGLAPGVDFAGQVRKELSNTKLMLVLIGANWIGVRTNQQPRLLDDNDFVRLEVSIGLASNTPVIPVLLGNATMPIDTDVPEEIQPLLRLQAAQVTHQRFMADMEPIVKMSAAALGLDTAWHKLRRLTLLAVGWLQTDSGTFNTLLLALLAAMAATIAFVPPWYLWPIDLGYLGSLWRTGLPIYVKAWHTYAVISPFSWVLICLIVQFALLLLPATIKRWRISSMNRTVRTTAITHAVVLILGITSSSFQVMLGGAEGFRNHPIPSLTNLIALLILLSFIGLAVWEFRFAKRLGVSGSSVSETSLKR